jgi:hypothetical protein
MRLGRRHWIGAAMCLWLFFASVLSLPYLIASILPNETYYWLKDHFRPIVLFVKNLVDMLAKVTH